MNNTDLQALTARIDRLKKLPRYLASGVGHVWLVDPSLRLVEVFAGSDGVPVRVAAGGDTEVLALPPFDGVFDLAPWWLPSIGNGAVRAPPPSGRSPCSG